MKTGSRPASSQVFGSRGNRVVGSSAAGAAGAGAGGAAGRSIDCASPRGCGCVGTSPEPPTRTAARAEAGPTAAEAAGMATEAGTETDAGADGGDWLFESDMPERIHHPPGRGSAGESFPGRGKVKTATV